MVKPEQFPAYLSGYGRQINPFFQQGLFDFLYKSLYPNSRKGISKILSPVV